MWLIFGYCSEYCVNRRAGNFREDYTLRFHHLTRFAKVYSQNCYYQNTMQNINTEITKFSSVKFFRYMVFVSIAVYCIITVLAYCHLFL